MGGAPAVGKGDVRMRGLVAMLLSLATTERGSSITHTQTTYVSHLRSGVLDGGTLKHEPNSAVGKHGREGWQ